MLPVPRCLPACRDTVRLLADTGRRVERLREAAVRLESRVPRRVIRLVRVTGRPGEGERSLFRLAASDDAPVGRAIVWHRLPHVTVGAAQVITRPLLATDDRNRVIGLKRGAAAVEAPDAPDRGFSHHLGAGET